MDNAYINEERNKDEMPQTIQEGIRMITQTWEQLLFGSGGKISAKKRYLWFIWWIWDGENARLATKEDVLRR
eukprot:762550-Ditylum_brightwellii.AAC.1